MYARGIIRFLVWATALIAVLRGTVYTDTFKPDTFPVIEAEKCAVCDTRIASFNIRCADVNGMQIKDRIQIAIEQIWRIAPDSMGVQEATDEWMNALRRMPRYEVVGEGREDDRKGEACPILYNKVKYKLLDSGTFWLSETPETPSFGWDAACKRICTWVKLRNRLTGAVYAHVNTHFDHVGKVAVVKEAEMLVDFIERELAGIPVVFTADLNATPDSDSYAVMTGALQDARLTAADAVSYGTFHACSPETHADYYIDFVMTTPGLEVETYRTVTAGVSGRLVSYHFPIYADVRLPDNGRTIS